MNRMSLFALPLVAAFALLSAKSGADDAAAIRTQKVYYPLTTCLMAGEPLGDDAVDVLHEGRLVRFCCQKCGTKFAEAPEAALKELDLAIVKAQLPGYAVDTCIVSGEKLGGMGDPVDVVHANRLVRFCCKACVKKFNSEPDAMLAKLDAQLIAAKVPTYPMKKCLVSGEELGGMGAPIDKVYGTDVVRFCCKSCVKSFEKTPQTFLSELHQAAKPADGARKGL